MGKIDTKETAMHVNLYKVMNKDVLIRKIIRLEKEADYLAGNRYKLDCPEKSLRKANCKMNPTMCQQCWREAARKAIKM